MEELGIVKNVKIGMRDCENPVMWFDVETLSGMSFLIFDLTQTGELIKQAQVYNIQGLEGRTCVVETEGRIMKWVRWHK